MIYLFSLRGDSYFDYEAIMEPAIDGGERLARSVWTHATGGYSTPNGAHYATMPIALAERMVLAGSAAGDLVIDPFNGAATTGAAAIGNGRRYVGFELNPDYVRLSLDRLAGVQPPMLVSSAGGLAVAPAILPVQSGMF
jgi:DNA modification methylase